MANNITINSLNQDHGRPMPMMIYGTAWKEGETADLVFEAIKAGFRGIDSGVGEHYNEPGVGEALQRVYRELKLERAALYIQTKIRLNDARFKDNTKYPTLESKVTASVKQSLHDLSAGQEDESYIDCLVIHNAQELKPGDSLRIARALQAFVPKQVYSIGVSNISADGLIALEAEAFIPAVVQNPFSLCGHDEFDAKVRAWCFRRNLPNFEPEARQFIGPNEMKWQQGYRVAYQGYHTVTSNRPVWQNAPYVKLLSEEHINVENINVWYSLLISDGIVVLNGTQNPEHMKTDVVDHKKIGQWRELHDKSTESSIWNKCLRVFRDAIAVDDPDDDLVHV